MNSINYKYNVGESVWGIEKNKVFCSVIGDVNIRVSKSGYKITYGLYSESDTFTSVFKDEKDLFLTKEALINSL